MVFRHYCSFGNKENRARLSTGNFVKMLKESPGLLEPRLLSATEAELIFTKSLARLESGGLESHLAYGDFLGALGRVADARLEGRERWGYLRGAEARLVALLQVSPAYPPQEVRKMCAILSQPFSGCKVCPPPSADAHTRRGRQEAQE